MPYVVRRTDGNVQIIIEDGLTNQDLGITLVGRSLTNYGEAFAENFVKLLENFASVNAPTNPLDGQIWFDKASRKFKFWNNGSWSVFADRGAIGYTGSKGATGLTGVEGPLGYTGSIGPQGYTGSVGPRGDTGATGPISTVGGPQGYTGSQGATGPISTTPGPIGYTGSRGNPGIQGPSGYVGSRGQSGPIGADGPKGDKGYTGSVGATGPGLSGNFSFSGQTISGTQLNQDITINPLGSGQVKTNASLVPSLGATYNIGASGAKFLTVYAKEVAFDSMNISGSLPPSTSKGQSGDTAGMMAFDQNYLYRCTGTYDGTTDIWKRVAWDGSSW